MFMFGTRKKKSENNNNSGSSILGNNKRVAPETGASSNRIGQGTKIQGEIITDGTIRIEGEIDGYIESKDRIIIGETGKVIGDIVCNSIDISGYVNGKLQVQDMLFLKSTAVVDGEIVTNKLVMESGATFNGNCKTKVSSTAKAFMSDNEKSEELAKKAV